MFLLGVLKLFSFVRFFGICEVISCSNSAPHGHGRQWRLFPQEADELQELGEHTQHMFWTSTKLIQTESGSLLWAKLLRESDQSS
jgi:hypothetical protein